MIVRVTNGVDWTHQAEFTVKPKASKQTIATAAIKALGWETLKVHRIYSPYCVQLTRKGAREDAFISLTTH